MKRAVAAYQRGQLSDAHRLLRAILVMKADCFDALHLTAVINSQQRRFEEALAGFARALALRPTHAEALYNRGVILNELKRLDEALASYERALAARPDYVEALYNRGVTLHELKRFEEALASYDRALALRPDRAEMLYNRGVTLQELKKFKEALTSYDRALAARPDYAEALNNRGNMLEKLKRLDEALASYNRALSVRPDYAEALYNRGNALKGLKRFEEALASYELALELRPDYIEALNNRGNTLNELRRFDEALTSFNRALELRPHFAEALNDRGNALNKLKRLDEALASYDRALSVRPDYAEALNNRGITLNRLRRLDEALASYDRALTVRPDYTEALYNRGVTLHELERFDEALGSYAKVLAITPDHLYSFGGLAASALKICDWTRTATLAKEIQSRIEQGKCVVSPFTLLGYCHDESIQLKCARSYIRDRIPTPPKPLLRDAIWRNDRIKIAYLSADFRRHATGQLIVELFERHDRNRFEVIGVSFGPDDRSELRSRQIKSFDHFRDVQFVSDLEIAQILSRMQTDIAVDLMGYTTYCRPEILSYRPAPIAAAYLGYPGTMGSDFIDYIIADKVVVPFDREPFYTEKIVHLPESYQVNSRLNIAGCSKREVAGLPEKGFVFCCFNNCYKINPPVFDVWMRLLKRVNGIVLWLMSTSKGACDRLRSEAAQRGINPARIIFAERQPLAEHLARHRLADLFVDTLPVNAHTTASDALWAGLPVLTCCGRSFAGRVATSLLNAVGLPELVTPNLEEYEVLAVRLATDPSLLADLKQKLEHNRLRCPLFDSNRFCHHIEAAYERMWEIWQRGESPRSFSVVPGPVAGQVLQAPGA
jgi:predicted O-linked N-acetylglucosamine transferase (SPINDLY family)